MNSARLLRYAPSLVAAGAIAAGIVVRLLVYATGTPLWGDEIMLQMNLLRRDFVELAAPLQYGQLAPVLFLWLQKALMTVLGPGERAVRLLPLLCSIAAVPLTASTVSTLISRRAGLVAGVLMSLSPTIVLYSNQAKQYTAELAATALVVWACVHYGWNRRVAGILVLMLSSIVAVLSSIPAIFVSAAAWASVLILLYRRGESLRMYIWAVCAGAMTAAVFLLLYFNVYTGVGNSGFMQRFWNPVYLSNQQSVSEFFRMPYLALITPVVGFGDTVPLTLGLPAAAAALVGLYRMVSDRRWPELILFAGPVAAVMAASLAGKWPMATRLLIFSAPLIVTMVCFGMETLTEKVSSTRQYVMASVLLLALSLALFRYDFYSLRHPSWTDNREVIADVLKRAGSQPIYVYAGAALDWLYYSENWTEPNEQRVSAWLSFARRLGDNPGNIEPRNRPVIGEGWDMVVRNGSRLELVGTESGAYSDGSGYHGLPPDSGWGDNEAARIAATGSDAVYVFIAYPRTPVNDDLFGGLQRRGFRIVEKREGLTSWYKLERAEPRG